MGRKSSRRDDERRGRYDVPVATVPQSPGAGIQQIPSPGVSAYEQARITASQLAGGYRRYQNLANTPRVSPPGAGVTFVGDPMPGRPAVHHSQVDKFFHTSIGQGPTRTPKGVSLVVPPAPSPSAQAVKPSVKLDQAGAKTLASKGVNLKADGGAMCRSVNRPPSNSGDGTSRGFIPWCSKGKKG